MALEQGRVRRLASLALIPMACRAASAKWRSCSSSVERDRSCSCSTVMRARSASRMRLASSSSLCRRMCACRRGHRGVQRGGGSRGCRVQGAGCRGRGGAERESGRGRADLGAGSAEALLRLCRGSAEALPPRHGAMGPANIYMRSAVLAGSESAISATSSDLHVIYVVIFVCVCTCSSRSCCTSAPVCALSSSSATARACKGVRVCARRV